MGFHWKAFSCRPIRGEGKIRTLVTGPQRTRLCGCRPYGTRVPSAAFQNQTVCFACKLKTPRRSVGFSRLVFCHQLQLVEHMATPFVLSRLLERHISGAHREGPVKKGHRREKTSSAISAPSAVKKQTMKLNDVTSAIIGTAIKVHKTLGPGLLESA